MLPVIKAVAFDAYGTLFDVYAVRTCAESLFGVRGHELVTLWRDKQIEYTRLRTLSGRYEDFWCITEDALQYSCELLGLEPSTEERDRLMNQYLYLPVFSEVVSALQRIRELRIPLAILSNGTRQMLESVVVSSKIETYFDYILSVDTIKKYKTAPEAYQLASDAFKLDPKDILFVSANGWDACCATWFGYTTFWINRNNAPIERLGIKPTVEGSNMKDIAEFLRS